MYEIRICYMHMKIEPYFLENQRSFCKWQFNRPIDIDLPRLCCLWWLHLSSDASFVSAQISVKDGPIVIVMKKCKARCFEVQVANLGNSWKAFNHWFTSTMDLAIIISIIENFELSAFFSTFVLIRGCVPHDRNVAVWKLLNLPKKQVKSENREKIHVENQSK